MSDRIIGDRIMERNSTIAVGRLPGGMNSAADKGVSAMILSYHDSVPPTFADKQANAHGRVPSRGALRNCHNENCWRFSRCPCSFNAVTFGHGHSTAPHCLAL